MRERDTTDTISVSTSHLCWCLAFNGLMDSRESGMRTRGWKAWYRAELNVVVQNAIQQNILLHRDSSLQSSVAHHYMSLLVIVTQ